MDHGVEQPLCTDHGARELRIFPAGNYRCQMKQHIDPFEGATQLARGAQVGPEDLHRGGPAERFQRRGRTDHGTNLDVPGEQRADHVPAEEPVGARDECPHSRCFLGLRASTMRLTSRTWLAVIGSADPPANAR